MTERGGRCQRNQQYMPVQAELGAKKPQLYQDQAQVVAGAAHDRMQRVANASRPAASAEAMPRTGAAHPEAERFVLQGTVHLPSLEAPQQFNSVLRRYLDRL